jgi:poly-gamma-glutamate capsule biosynthesis protein CapA/YwtB (metallophosphatase superfamily)
MFSGMTASYKRRTLVLLAMLLLLGTGFWQWAAKNTLQAQAAEKNAYPKELGRITFAVAGDVIPHQAVTQSAAAKAAEGNGSSENGPANHAGWDTLFAEVAGVFQHSDFGFVNLETPVAPRSSRGSKPFQFDAPIALLQALKSSGIQLVSFANNHVFDQGVAGFAETMGHLKESGIQFAGAGESMQAAWQPVILEKNQIKIGVLGMTRWLNGHRNPEKAEAPHAAFFPAASEDKAAVELDEKGVLEKVKAARAQCDLLLVSIHWGIEYAPAPRQEDAALAHALVEAGADVIIGHHPHVPQPVETYLSADERHCLILYSLGNFLCNQSRFFVQDLMPDKTGEPRQSMIVRFAAIKNDFGPAGSRVELGGVSLLPVWIQNNTLQANAGLEKTLFIHPVLMDREIAHLQSQADALAQSDAPMTANQKQQFLQLSKQLETLRRQRQLLLERTGDDYVVPPPAEPGK